MLFTTNRLKNFNLSVGKFDKFDKLPNPKQNFNNNLKFFRIFFTQEVKSSKNILTQLLILEFLTTNSFFSELPNPNFLSKVQFFSTVRGGKKFLLNEKFLNFNEFSYSKDILTIQKDLHFFISNQNFYYFRLNYASFWLALGG